MRTDRNLYKAKEPRPSQQADHCPPARLWRILHDQEFLEKRPVGSVPRNEFRSLPQNPTIRTLQQYAFICQHGVSGTVFRWMPGLGFELKALSCLTLDPGMQLAFRRRFAAGGLCFPDRIAAPKSLFGLRIPISASSSTNTEVYGIRIFVLITSTRNFAPIRSSLEIISSCRTGCELLILQKFA